MRLSDQRKKASYDNGHDIEDNDPALDPNQMFRTFFQL